jgi:hypothetical protein
LEQCGQWQFYHIGCAHRASGSQPHELAWALSESGSSGDIIDGVKSPEMIFKSSQQALAISNEHGFIQWLLSGSLIGGWYVGALG